MTDSHSAGKGPKHAPRMNAKAWFNSEGQKNLEAERLRRKQQKVCENQEINNKKIVEGENGEV